jgi:hypothetical protein
MKPTKRLGIWMDHSVAHLIELENNSVKTSSVVSKPETQVNESDLYYKDESHKLNKEQGLLSAYYTKLSDSILNYDHILLFGPTDAKNELANLLKDNHLFDQIKVVTKSADKMTALQQQTFVTDYFNTIS